jgi:hypothetical protein
LSIKAPAGNSEVAKNVSVVVDFVVTVKITNELDIEAGFGIVGI